MKIPFIEYHLIRLLNLFDQQTLSLGLFLNQYFRKHKQLGSKDRRYIADIIYEMWRWQSLIDYLIDGLPSWEKRYAYLKTTFQPSDYLPIDTIPIHIRLSLPKELFALLVQDYGEKKAIELCQVFNTKAPIFVRINPIKITREALIKRWAGFNAVCCRHSPLGIKFKDRVPLIALSEFKQGLFEMQDEGSQCVAQLMDIRPGQQVLDYCAGSGGKTLAFAFQMKNEGTIYLHDIRLYMLNRAKKRLKRMGIKNVQFLHSKHPDLPHLKKKMDWILVDVPCTGTGTLRRNPDQKWKFSTCLLNKLIKKQRDIFKEALSFLKPEGHIIYATCSILRSENQKQAAYFRKTHHLKICGKPFLSKPSYGEMDGFFAICFKKNST
ncbi:MAG: RsmB/NOP family class I SAM-dependent RNA methyltransferase [Chlamydiales bacterium]